jgi:hypothetical protein
MADGGGADSMHRFQLERGGDRMKRCWKMKRRCVLVLAPWEESVTWHDGMAMSVEER